MKAEDQDILDNLLISPEHFNAWRQAQDLFRFMDADISGADLSNRYLRGVNLENICMDGANFQGSDLAYARITNGSCSRANFQDTNLACADLTNQLAVGIDLRNAYLGCRIGSEVRTATGQLQRRIADTRNGTLFCDTTLANADFRGAILNCTYFLNMDMTYCVGLEDCSHEDSSYLDLLTVSRSERLPITFLKQAGVPDSLATNISLLRGMPFEHLSCFISYTSSDAIFARRLYSALTGLGIRTWHDEHSLQAGQDLQDEIHRGIKSTDVLLLCCSEASMNSWWVERELDSAFRKEQLYQKETGNKKMFLIPLDLDGYILSNACTSSRVDELLTRKVATFKGWHTEDSIFESAFQFLQNALRTDFTSPSPPYKYQPGERFNPFRR